MRLPLLALLALASAVSTLRAALPKAAEIAAAFRALDTSGNGAISLSEWDRGSFALFSAADKNNNNFIDPEELAGSNVAQDTFRRIDTDHDGRLSISEFMELRRDIFAVADIDRDDSLLLVEYELLVVFEAIGWFDRNQTGRIEVTELRETLTKAFEMLDTNHDGKLDATETAYMQPDRFKRFDRNQDGTLTLEEVVMGYRAEFGA